MALLVDALTGLPNLISPINFLEVPINTSLFFLSYYIAVLLMLAGSWEYFNIRSKLKPVILISIPFFCFALYSSWWKQEFLVAAITASAFMGSIQIYIAYLFFINRKQGRYLTYHVFSLTMFISGVHLFDYPFFRNIESLAPIGFFTATLLGMIITVTLTIIVLQDFFERVVVAENRAIELAIRDELTGLYNRRYLDNIFEQLMAQAIRSNKRLAILFLDLDNFKPINDTYGHDTGDHALKIIAQRLQNRARKADIAVRLGGDEFILILTNIESADDAWTFIKKLQLDIADEIIMADKSFSIKTSIGTSLFPDDGNSLKNLIRHADQNMYRVKQQKALL